MPDRIQLRRTKGWRMPANTVKVDRTTKWGNTFRIGDRYLHEYRGEPGNGRPIYRKVKDAAMAKLLFARALLSRCTAMLDFSAGEVAQLRGKNLACWCKLCEAHRNGKPLGIPCPDCAPCHADPLGYVANRPIRSVPLCPRCGELPTWCECPKAPPMGGPCPTDPPAAA